MSLLVYNLTAAPLVLANGVRTKIPASSAGAGVRGNPWYASGNEMKGRSLDQYLNLQAQQDAGLVSFVWPVYEEYPTPGLIVQIGAQPPSAPSSEVYPVLSKVIVLGESGEQDGTFAATIFAAAPYPIHLLHALCILQRGAEDAKVRICCDIDALYSPYFEFDASRAGQPTPYIPVNRDGILCEGDSLNLVCTNDYVRGRVTLMYQRIE